MLDNYYTTPSNSYGRSSGFFGRAGGGGVQSQMTFGNQPTPQIIPKNPLTSAYNAAASTQSADYDNIMKGYNDYISQNKQTPQMQFQPITPQQYQYSQSADSAASLASLKNLADTGGYSDQDIADLRARGVSPIRSVYSSAQQNIERQKALQGGFSPNYTAATAKMSRDMADSISNQMSNVNAGIAQNVASNKLSAAPQYAQAAGAESALRNSYGSHNADTVNNANEFNAQMPLEYGKYNQGIRSNTLGALQGMSSLYGTNPALASFFGNHALQSAGLQNEINQGNNTNNLRLISSMISGLN